MNTSELIIEVGKLKRRSMKRYSAGDEWDNGVDYGMEYAYDDVLDFLRDLEKKGEDL